jgi:hypothetical protein
MNHPLPPGYRKAFGDTTFEEIIESFNEAYETREELIKRMESLFCRWRHHQSGWDISGSRQERDEGFESALDLLSECYEELNG